MSNTKKMTQNKKLKNAPLKEVILEIHWDGNIDDFGNKFDEGFELSQGAFFEKIKSSFPIYKKNQQLYTTTTFWRTCSSILDK